MRNVTILGAGYVGLPTATHFASQHRVTLYDPQEDKINNIREALGGEGELPVHEKGLLEKLLLRHENMNFTSKLEEAMDNPELVFIAVGTPPDSQGKADLKYVKEAARQVGKNLDNEAVVLNKSTVPPGTAYLVESTIEYELERRGVEIPFSVGSCPEFLAEGSAMEDLRVPDRVVFGSDDEDALRRIKEFFSYLHDENKLVPMSTVSAELTKYASNGMLATKISYMNELALLCDDIGADVKEVARGMGMDSRIGPKFLNAGFGYGGSCFPKDTKAIKNYAEELGIDLGVISAAVKANSEVLNGFYSKIEDHYGGELRGRNFGLWGVGFKAGTDDLRESRSVELMRMLEKAGAHVTVYDPVPGAIRNLERELVGNYSVSNSQYGVCESCDGLIIGNEWEGFRSPDVEKLSDMRNRVVFDGKNCVSRPAVDNLVSNGFIYKSVGRDLLAQEVDKKKLVKFLEEVYCSG